MNKGREIQEQTKATQSRNPNGVLNQGKKKKKREPTMLGPPTMAISIEGSRFKSSFGELDRP